MSDIIAAYLAIGIFSGSAAVVLQYNKKYTTPESVLISCMLITYLWPLAVILFLQLALAEGVAYLFGIEANANDKKPN